VLPLAGQKLLQCEAAAAAVLDRRLENGDTTLFQDSAWGLDTDYSGEPISTNNMQPVVGSTEVHHISLPYSPRMDICVFQIHTHKEFQNEKLWILLLLLPV